MSVKSGKSSAIALLLILSAWIEAKGKKADGPIRMVSKKPSPKKNDLLFVSGSGLSQSPSPDRISFSIFGLLN